MAIVLWIGIVISAQAFQATPREHAPAVVDRAAAGHRRVGRADGEERPARGRHGRRRRVRSRDALIGEFLKSDTWIHGAFSLEQGFLFTSMLLSAAVVAVIERQWIEGRRLVRRGVAAFSRGPDALVSVDDRRHRAEARAGVAVRDRLRDCGARVLHGEVDDRARGRARLTSACAIGTTLTSAAIFPRSELRPTPGPDPPPRIERMNVLVSSSGSVATLDRSCSRCCPAGDTARRSTDRTPRPSDRAPSG